MHTYTHIHTHMHTYTHMYRYSRAVKGRGRTAGNDMSVLEKGSGFGQVSENRHHNKSNFGTGIGSSSTGSITGRAHDDYPVVLQVEKWGR